jgi:hypothetical protein
MLRLIDGFPTEQWTATRLAQLIQEEWGITFHLTWQEAGSDVKVLKPEDLNGYITWFHLVWSEQILSPESSGRVEPPGERVG